MSPHFINAFTNICWIISLNVLLVKSYVVEFSNTLKNKAISVSPLLIDRTLVLREEFLKVVPDKWPQIDNM